jgi:hypothetical protein
MMNYSRFHFATLQTGQHSMGAAVGGHGAHMSSEFRLIALQQIQKVPLVTDPVAPLEKTSILPGRRDQENEDRDHSPRWYGGGCRRILNHFRRFTVLSRNRLIWAHGRHKKDGARSQHKRSSDLIYISASSARRNIIITKTLFS